SNTFYGEIKSQSNHPLAIASTKIFSIWPTSVSSDQNSNFISLDTNNVTGLIEEKRGNLKSIAFIMPSIYGYEFSITGYSFKTACNFGSGDVWFNSPSTDSLPEAFVAIADYFEQNLRVSAANSKLTNINSPALDKLKELKEDPPQTENMLFEKLKSKNPLEAASALDQLVNNGSIDKFEDLLPFLEHGSFVVRLRASHLIAIILAKEANPHFKILNKLDEPYLSEKAHKALTWSLSFLHP
ncbi:MAG: hypothetical protein HY843_04575, partial [Bdellovibrio sp.]|nr:hypothetical protein [Bdellovibrio sp.]